MLLLVVGLVLFFAIHVIPQMSAFKQKLEGQLGVTGYRIFHGVVALLAVILIVKGYFDSRYDVILWVPPIWTRHLALTLMLFASILLFSAPFYGKIKQKLTSPLSVAIKIWALAHLLANGSLSDVVMFGFFLFFAVTYRISLKKRIAAGLVSVPVGRALYDVYAVVLGLVFYGVMVMWLHQWAFDVSPIYG